MLGGLGNTIGGLTATPGSGAGNLISGNNGTGITDYGGSNVIAGNLIGTAAGGSGAVANASDGIDLYEGGDTIGGSATGVGNVISGNDGYGIYDDGANLIAGNLIGTDASGTFAVPNDYPGIYVQASGSTIGGTTAAAGNVISGNNQGGIIVFASSNLDRRKQGWNQLRRHRGGGQRRRRNRILCHRQHDRWNDVGGRQRRSRAMMARAYPTSPGTNLIAGNLIGTNAGGTAAVANAGDGIDVNASGDTIGGTIAAAGNLISGNDYGITISFGHGQPDRRQPDRHRHYRHDRDRQRRRRRGYRRRSQGQQGRWHRGGSGQPHLGQPVRRRSDLWRRHHRQHGRRQPDRHRHYRHSCDRQRHRRLDRFRRLRQYDRRIDRRAGHRRRQRDFGQYPGIDVAGGTTTRSKAT